VTTKKNYKQKMLDQEGQENLNARFHMMTNPTKKKTYEIIAEYIGCSMGKWVRLVLDDHIKSIDDPKLLKLIKENSRLK